MNSARSAANGVVPRSNTSALEPAPRRLKSVWTKRSDGVMGALAVAAARGPGAAPALSKPRGPCGAVRILAADSLESSTLPASTPDSAQRRGSEDQGVSKRCVAGLAEGRAAATR